MQADIIALVGVRSGSKADTLDRYEFSKGEHGAVSFMQDVTAGIQKQQRAKGLWHFTVSPSIGMTLEAIGTTIMAQIRRMFQALMQLMLFLVPGLTCC